MAIKQPPSGEHVRGWVTSSICPIFEGSWASRLWGLIETPAQESWSSLPPVAWSLMWTAMMPSSVTSLHPRQPAQQHMEMVHLSQSSPSSHQLHRRWLPCQKGQWHGQTCHWRMHRCAIPHTCSLQPPEGKPEGEMACSSFSIPLMKCIILHIFSRLCHQKAVTYSLKHYLSGLDVFYFTALKENSRCSSNFHKWLYFSAWVRHKSLFIDQAIGLRAT